MSYNSHLYFRRNVTCRFLCNYNPLSHLFLLHFLALPYALHFRPGGPCRASYALRRQEVFSLILMLIFEGGNHEIRGGQVPTQPHCWDLSLQPGSAQPPWTPRAGLLALGATFVFVQMMINVLNFKHTPGSSQRDFSLTEFLSLYL